MIQFHIFPEPLRSPDKPFPPLVIKEKKKRSRGEREKALHHLGFGPPEPTGPAGRPTPPHRSLPPLPVPLLRVATGARSTPTTSPASPGEDKGDASGSPHLPSPTHSPWTPPLPSLPLASPPSPDPPRPDALSPPRCCATASTGPSSLPRCVHEPRSRLLLRLHQQPQGGSHPSAGSVFLLDRRRRRFRLRPRPLRSCYSSGLRAPTQ